MVNTNLQAGTQEIEQTNTWTVVQSVAMQTITEVSEFPSYTGGIINLYSLIILPGINESCIRFIVDEVDSIVTIEDALIALHLTFPV